MLAVFFETFGCQMNVADSDLLADALARMGYGVAGSSDEAHLVIVNTCSVRDRAEQRALGRIRELAGRRRRLALDQQIWVVGCMAQRMGDELGRLVPGIDRVVGAKEIEHLQEHIEVYLVRKEGGLAHARPRGAVSAFIPVMRGCDNFCSYCIVPHVRGREVSLASDAVLENAAALAADGVVEITLLGQNVNSYRDPVTSCDFPRLLERLHDVGGIERIRFTTSHPKDCSPGLVEAFATLPRLCAHLHLPVQSGSSRILAAMNRGYTRERYLELVAQLRERIPHLDLTTDVMVGFPGEEPEDFEQTLSLFEQVRFTSAFMFAYSPRPETAAAAMTPQVPREDAGKRLARLIDVQTGITRQVYAAMRGASVQVLFTRRQNRREQSWTGQTRGAMRAVLSCEGIRAGTILDVRVVDSSGQTLICERT